MINWNNYKQEIIAMAEEGMSSSEIAGVLSKTHSEIKRTSDRSIRNALQRWRDNNDLSIIKKPAKVLLFDIETAPMISYVWSRKPQYINQQMIIDDWYVLCWAAKWLFEDEIISSRLTPKESKNNNDVRVVKELWDLLNEADIVIAHYGDKFDIKMMNGRFLKYGLNLPMPYKSIDTKKEASKRMRLPAFNLDYIARYLGLDGKIETNFSLWEKSMKGDKKALEQMDIYCRQDVRVLEDVYLKLRPYIQPHPNLGLYIKEDTKICPSCGSTNLDEQGTYVTTVNSYRAYRCKDCGSITRSRKSSLSNEDKKSITSSVPK